MARRNKPNMYRPADFGETELVSTFMRQRDEARTYFLSQIKPRLDRSYKLFVGYNGDRAKEIQKWQANIFVPYIQSVIETLMPRILDARPDFGVQGRTWENDVKARKLENLIDYFWEKSGMDQVVEDFVRACMMYGTGFLQVYWKKDVRKLQFLKTDDISKKLKWEEKDQIFFDAPTAEWIDNYNLWYDWRNVNGKLKRFWFKRLVITKAEIERRYPMASKKKLDLITPGGDISDYAYVRRETKQTHMDISRGRGLVSDFTFTSNGLSSFLYDSQSQNELYEVFEWYRPFEDKFAVMANNVPILEEGEIPNPYNFKETCFVDCPYLRVPGEFEGYGIPLILENPQIMLNMIKNQRLDAVTLNIHKMWVVNPLANIDKSELVTRPFGIIYSTDPNGVREVQFSDVKQSAYQEEEMLKQDMRYASGVDDYSMGAGGGASSATEIRHLRESTIERVRLFVNHLGDSFSTVMRYWISMTQQFWTDDMTIRIIGKDGKVEFPLISRDDIMGEFDFKATVLPSIAGQQDIQRKQDMDLLQLLMGMPFIDQQKVVTKVLYDWDWDFQSVAKSEEQMQQEQQAAQQQQKGPAESISFKDLPPEGQVQMAAQAGIKLNPPAQPQAQPQQSSSASKNEIPKDLMARALSLLGKGSSYTASSPSPFSEAGAPIPINENQTPPTVAGIPANQGQGEGGPKNNPRGHNRNGKVNTNISQGNNANPESTLLNRTFNIQR